MYFKDKMSLQEESFQKIRDEEEKRKEVSAKFQVTLNEITELMKQDNDKTMKLRDDNIDMTSKLKSIYEQYEMREQVIEVFIVNRLQFIFYFQVVEIIN